MPNVTIDEKMLKPTSYVFDFGLVVPGKFSQPNFIFYKKHSAMLGSIAIKRLNNPQYIRVGVDIDKHMICVEACKSDDGMTVPIYTRNGRHKKCVYIGFPDNIVDVVLSGKEKRILIGDYLHDRLYFKY